MVAPFVLALNLRALVLILISVKFIFSDDLVAERPRAVFLLFLAGPVAAFDGYKDLDRIFS
jgi:hypothetical protein